MGRWAASEQDTDKLKDGIIAVYNRKNPPPSAMLTRKDYAINNSKELLHHEIKCLEILVK